MDLKQLKKDAPRGADKKIQYLASNANWTVLDIAVIGWR